MDSADDSNAGYKARNALFVANQPVQLRGRLQCAIFKMNRFMLNNVNVTIKLSRTRPDFYLMGKGEDHKIIISDCFLRVKRVRVSAATMLQHALELERTTAKYPMKRIVVCKKKISLF
jgi:hypothetical protein